MALNLTPFTSCNKLGHLVSNIDSNNSQSSLEGKVLTKNYLTSTPQFCEKIIKLLLLIKFCIL